MPASGSRRRNGSAWSSTVFASRRPACRVAGRALTARLGAGIVGNSRPPPPTKSWQRAIVSGAIERASTVDQRIRRKLPHCTRAKNSARNLLFDCPSPRTRLLFSRPRHAAASYWHCPINAQFHRAPGRRPSRSGPLLDARRRARDQVRSALARVAPTSPN
jgi:hypothetical protein